MNEEQIETTESEPTPSQDSDAPVSGAQTDGTHDKEAGESLMGEPSTEKPEEPSGLMQEDAEPKADDVLGAPEGEYEVKAPEGVSISDDTLGAIGEVAKELNLSNKAVQSLVDKVGPVMQAQQAKALAQYRAEWAKASKADPEFGGDSFSDNIKGINSAYNRFTTPEFRSLMKESGLDNHPEFLRHFYRLSKMSGYGRVAAGANATTIREDDPRAFYKGLR